QVQSTVKRPELVVDEIARQGHLSQQLQRLEDRALPAPVLPDEHGEPTERQAHVRERPHAPDVDLGDLVPAAALLPHRPECSPTRRALSTPLIPLAFVIGPPLPSRRSAPWRCAEVRDHPSTLRLQATPQRMPRSTSSG